MGLPDGSRWVRDELEGDSAEPLLLGEEVAERVLAAGGERCWRDNGPVTGTVYLVGAGSGDRG